MFFSPVDSSTCGYCAAGMSDSSVYRTWCCEGMNPVRSVAREGEHMHALVKAFSNTSPLRFSRCRPGRFFSAQPFGKCWIARSWSVMNMTTFIPRSEVAAASASGPPAARASRAAPPSMRAGIDAAAPFSS